MAKKEPPQPKRASPTPRKQRTTTTTTFSDNSYGGKRRQTVNVEKTTPTKGGRTTEYTNYDRAKVGAPRKVYSSGNRQFYSDTKPTTRNKPISGKRGPK